MFKKYIEYLKDNPKGYWFKRKLYGYGWTPATREGWLVTLGFVFVLLFMGYRVGNNPAPSEYDILWLFVQLALAIVVISVICFRTGEKPKWQWGLPKKNK